MFRWWVLALLVVAPTPGLAQDLPDASLPDASVDQGGADQGSEENDTSSGPCLDARTCDHGFTCSGGRCVPAPVREAACGGALALAAPLALAVVRARRRHAR